MKKRFSRFEFWDGAIFGAVIGVVFTLGLGWALAGLSEEYWSISGDIFAVVGVLFAALIALKGVRSQIETQLKINNENRKQELAAYRATLPIALAQLADISISGMQFSVAQDSLDQAALIEIKEKLGMPADVLDTLRNCIKSSDPISQRWLSAIISNYQISFSRSIGMLVRPPSDNEEPVNTLGTRRTNLALDWAVLHLLIGHTFEFGRGTVDRIPPLIDTTEITNSIYFSGLYRCEDELKKGSDKRFKNIIMADVSVFEK